ncbi:MAG: hypothetical protein GSR81_06110 [Desulfurococcales archaeon]|nr:hypothetical protein [Desulfurococcales archaeon]
MQVKKEKMIRKASSSEKMIIDGFCSSIGVEPSRCYSHLYVLDIPRAPFKDVFDPSPSVLLFLKDHLEWNAYSIGFYLGILGKNKFEPSLLLAHKLVRFCPENINCVTLNPEGEKYFLYGRPVFGENIVSYNSLGPVLVENTLREALGWGRLVSEDNTKYGRRLVLRPVKDLGWYLRKGG